MNIADAFKFDRIICRRTSCPFAAIFTRELPTKCHGIFVIDGFADHFPVQIRDRLNECSITSFSAFSCQLSAPRRRHRNRPRRRPDTALRAARYAHSMPPYTLLRCSAGSCRPLNPENITSDSAAILMFSSYYPLFRNIAHDMFHSGVLIE